MSIFKNFSMSQLNRVLHRDLGFFFTGLIIAFAISGIALNHRRSWSPSQYVYKTQEVKVPIPSNGSSFNEEYCKKVFADLGMNDGFRFVRVKGRNVRVYYRNGVIDINKRTGEGTAEFYRKRPVLAQMVQLHMSSHGLWIWFSDIFGLALLIITITGLVLNKGKNGFRKRGWKLVTSGLLIPIGFLLFIL